MKLEGRFKDIIERRESIERKLEGLDKQIKLLNKEMGNPEIEDLRPEPVVETIKEKPATKPEKIENTIKEDTEVVTF